MDPRKLKQIKISSIVGFILIVIISIFGIIFQEQPRVKIDIMTSPRSAKIYVGDKEYQNGTFEIVPGEYDVKISHESFNELNEHISIANNSTFNLHRVLELLDSASTWYDEHPEDLEIAGTIAHEEAEIETAKFFNENSWLNQLPINVDYYTSNRKQHIQYEISANITNTSELEIIINDTNGTNYNAAMEKIRNLGIDEAKVKIIYNNNSSLNGWGKAK